MIQPTLLTSENQTLNLMLYQFTNVAKLDKLTTYCALNKLKREKIYANVRVAS